MRTEELFASRGVAGFGQPFLIAEAGVNHECSLDLALRLVDEAKEGGADAIKFQTYKADSLASKHSPAYWDTTKEKTRSQHELFSKYDKFGRREFEALKKHCDQVGIEFISTPFDVASADYLNELMDVFKISSSDITNKPFIEHMCRFGKPILLSTGASHLHEIHEAVSWIKPFGNPLVLMHCVLNYPTDDQNANLGMISDLKARFPGAVIGYSDHTLPRDMKTLEVATILGARVLEKHFTHDKTLPGNDHYHSADREDLKAFRRNMERVLALLGDGEKHALASEEPARNNARRSLVAGRAIKKGEKIGRDHLTWKRPAHGISPREIDRVLGRAALQDIPEDTPLRWGMLSD